MKITSASLTASNIVSEAPHAVNSVNKEQEPAPVNPAVQPPAFKKGEADLTLLDAEEMLPPEYIAMIRATDYSFAANLRSALYRRERGDRILSLRECDIACRSSLIKELHTGTVIDFALMDLGWFLCEGIVGLDHNPWELRSRYNKGIIFVASTEDERLKIKANAVLASILKALDEMHHLPAREDEIKNGFHVDLLRPEWMEANKYFAIHTQRRKLFTPEG